MLRSIVTGAALFLALASPVLADEAVPAPVAPAAATSATAASAIDVPQAVKDACQGDYEKLCSEHKPESDAVRECMARAFDKLSDGCVNAILDSPLADQASEQVAAYDDADAASARIPAPEAAIGTRTLQTRPSKISRALHGKRLTRTSRAHRGQRLASSSRNVFRAKRSERIAHSGRSGRPQARVRHARRVAKAVKAHRPAVRTASSRYRGSKRSVAGYIRRGTGIARYYVGKYVRFAYW